MKILVLADKESKYLWDYYERGKLDDVDLILSAGDLKAEYLEFLVTFAKCPLLYVHGNHDTKYAEHPPEGCICIDDSLFVYKGVRILGLGGSMRYKNGKFQYTEKEMQRRIRRRTLDLLRYGGFDILLTHAPMAGFHDMEDLPHRGFACFGRLLEKYSPHCFVHGHVHLNYGKFPRVDTYGETTVVNAYEKYVVDYQEDQNACISNAIN